MELAELALALLLAYDRSGAGNHNALQLTNAAEHWQQKSMLTEFNDVPLQQINVNRN